MVFILSLLLQVTPSTADFEDRLKRATGPAQLKQLEAWCTKNKREAEKKRVQDLLAKALAVRTAADAAQREAARVSGDHARESVDSFREGRARSAAKELRCVSLDELIIQVGYGKVTSQQVLEKALPELAKKEHEAPAKTESMLKTLLRKVTRRTSTSGIKVAGEEDILVRFAKCCSPLPGDPIVGFITRGRGVTVHRRDCDKGLDLDPERRIDVEWDGQSKTQHEVALQVLCANKPGLLANISQSFSDQGVNISQAHCRTTEDGRAVNTFHASVRDLDQLKSVIRLLSRIKGVFSVDRVSADVGT
jgi:GTP pyrophosphokinase